MASLHFSAQHGRYRIRFDFGGQSYNRSLGKVTGTLDEAKADAEATLARVEKTLGLLRDGFFTMPDNADHAQFILTGGKETGRPKVAAVRRLQDLFDAVKAHTPSGAKEEDTLETEEFHRNHLVRLLGGQTQLRLLEPSALQAYIATRSDETYRGEKISAQTIRKEVGRLQADWNRVASLKLLAGLGGPPTKGLHYPKDSEKPPFRTSEQIEVILARSGADEDRARADLWESLFLRVSEIEEVLELVRQKANCPFVHPMFAFVAYTGARRSEMIRSRIEDIDFAAKLVRVREKKRDRKKEVTFRHVDMCDSLARILRAWFDGAHPGGPYTISQPQKTRMKSRTDWVSLTKDEARHHFEGPLAGSKWAVIPGFHCFRHSFASNAALQNVPAAQIDAWMGHQTEEMRNRYRHLFPEQGRTAIESLFGRQ